MGRKAEFGGGGGFLNNVDATISYQFTTDPPFANPGGYVYAVVSAAVDGKEDPDTTALFLGGGDSFEVSADGAKLVPIDGAKLGRTTPWAKFLSSVEEPTEGGEGHPGVQDDDRDIIGYRALNGSRVRLTQQPISTEEIAKLASKGKRTTREGKNGKEYPLTNLVVSKFYSVGNGNGNGKAASKAPSVAPKVDVAALAQRAATAVLGAAEGQTLSASRLVTKAGLYMLQSDNDSQTEAVKGYLEQPLNLAKLAGVAYNAKKGIVSLEEGE